LNLRVPNYASVNQDTSATIAPTRPAKGMVSTRTLSPHISRVDTIMSCMAPRWNITATTCTSLGMVIWRVTRIFLPRTI